MAVQAPAFDPIKYKQTTLEQWQSAAKARGYFGPLLRRWLGLATDIAPRLLQRVRDNARQRADFLRRRRFAVAITAFLISAFPAYSQADLWVRPAPNAGPGSFVACDGPARSRELCFSVRNEVTGAAVDAWRISQDGGLAWSATLPNYISGMGITALGASEALVLTAHDGFAYSYDVSLGFLNWALDTRRAICPVEDKLLAPPAVQKSSLSNAAFQAAFPGDDLFFVNTAYGCGDVRGNRILAFDRAGNVRWTFNPFGIELMDRGWSRCAVDYSSNTLYCATDQRNGASQKTLWAIDTTTGHRRWAASIGPTRAAPALSNGRLYVATTDGTLAALDPATGALLWSLANAGGAERDLSLYQRPEHFPLILYSDGALRVRAYKDLGTTAALSWISSSGSGLVRAAPVSVRGTGYGYVGTTTGVVYQVDLKTGAWDAAAWTSFAGTDLASLSLDRSVFGGPTDRLIGIGSAASPRFGTVARSGIPWFSGASGGPFAANFAASRFAADVSVRIAAPAEAIVGSEFDIVFTATNHGPDWATDVTALGHLPFGALSSAVSQGQVLRGRLSRELVASFGDLAPNAAATLTVRVSADRTGVFTSTATVSAGERDPNPADNSGSVTIAVSPKNDQTISFGPLPNRTFGDPPFTVSATASSGLPVTFSASGQCTVAGSTVTITGGGSCTLTASQVGDASYNPAVPVSQTFTIACFPDQIPFAIAGPNGRASLATLRFTEQSPVAGGGTEGKFAVDVALFGTNVTIATGSFTATTTGSVPSATLNGTPVQAVIFPFVAALALDVSTQQGSIRTTFNTPVGPLAIQVAFARRDGAYAIIGIAVLP